MKILENTLNVCAILLILFFFFPWFTIGNTVSFTGAALPQGARNFHIMSNGAHAAVPPLILLTYAVYLVPVAAFFMMVVKSMVKDPAKSRSINRGLSFVPVTSIAASMIFFFAAGGAGMIQCFSIGAYLSCITALCLIIAAFDVIRFGPEE